MSELATIEKEVQDALSIAKTIVVTTNEEETFAVEFCKIIKNAQKQVGDEFDAGIEDAHALHKKLVAQRKKYLDPLEKAEKSVKDAIKSYRLDLELARQAEQAKQKAILDAQVKADQDKLMAQAEAAQAAGDKNTADRLAVQATTIEAGGVHIESKATKQEGMSSSIVWKGRVVDLTQVPQEFLIITANDKAIAAHIKAHGKNFPIKGVEYYQDVNLSVRT